LRCCWSFLQESAEQQKSFEYEKKMGGNSFAGKKAEKWFGRPTGLTERRGGAFLIETCFVMFVLLS
jgi:hypothetical protein